MILEQTTQDDVLVLRPVGRLDSNSSPELERAVLEHLEKVANGWCLISLIWTMSARLVCG